MTAEQAAGNFVVADVVVSPRRRARLPSPPCAKRYSLSGIDELGRVGPNNYLTYRWRATPPAKWFVGRSVEVRSCSPPFRRSRIPRLTWLEETITCNARRQCFSGEAAARQPESGVGRRAISSERRSLYSHTHSQTHMHTNTYWSPDGCQQHST